MSQIAKKLASTILASSRLGSQYSKLASQSTPCLYRFQTKSLSNTFDKSFFSRKKTDEAESTEESKNKDKKEEKEQKETKEDHNAEKKEEKNQKEAAQTKEAAEKDAAIIKKLEAQLRDKTKEAEDFKKRNDVNEKKNEELQKKVNELRDNLVKQIEEVESTSKRLQKEKEAMKVFAITKFAKEILEVADNLGMALKTSAKKYEDSNDDLYEGVKMTNSVLLKIFERNGIQILSPLSEKFDPNMHEALFEIDDPKMQPGTCGHIAQVGYKLGDRCLRPARVGVVKARPAEESNQEAAKQEEKK